MENQREIYEALLAGEILINNRGCKVKLCANGNVRYEDDEGSDGRFLVSLEWQIYKEPKWYENIPDGGVLCWCGTSKSLRLIESFVFKSLSPDSNTMPAFRTRDYDEGDWWLICEPLTKQEIQVFMDNAPEANDD